MRSQVKRRDKRDYRDQLFRRFIKARDECCQVCGSPGPLECAHFFGRRFLSVRWDPDNAAALCKPCHRVLDEDNWRKWHWIEERLGPECLQELRRRKDQAWDRDYGRVLTEVKVLLESIREAV